MREIVLNGYIDEDVWYGDEITPAMLHDRLFADGENHDEPVRIILNSYGGSCNAATRMYDDVRAYPGDVHIVISGTAASAATVLAMSADRLEMTPGSMWMIHDPSIFAFGNVRDLAEAIGQLNACKESILNVYERRCHRSRDEIATMMSDTTWMDSHRAAADGFVDGICDVGNGVTNSVADRVIVLKDAQAKVELWHDRTKRRLEHRDNAALKPAAVAAESAPANASINEVPVSHPVYPGVPVAQLHKRLELIKPRRK